MTSSTPAIIGFCALNTILAASAGYLAGRAAGPSEAPAAQPAVSEAIPVAPSGTTALAVSTAQGTEAMLVADMINLAGDVDALRAELTQLREERRSLHRVPGADGPAPAGAAPPPVNSTALFSAAEEFLVAEGSGDGLENLDLVFQDEALGGVDLLSTNCQGNMCRLSYDAQGGSLGASIESSMALSRLVSQSVGGGVDIIFDHEYGEPVLYVKRVN